MHSRAIAILATLAFCGSCAVTGQEAEQSAAREPQTEKMSLDEALDDHRSVTLLDDETGEKKLICKRVVVTGDRFVRKTCATPEEWAQKKTGFAG